MREIDNYQGAMPTLVVGMPTLLRNATDAREGRPHQEHQEGDSSLCFLEEITDGKLNLCTTGAPQEFAALCYCEAG